MYIEELFQGEISILIALACVYLSSNRDLSIFYLFREYLTISTFLIIFQPTKFYVILIYSKIIYFFFRTYIAILQRNCNDDILTNIYHLGRIRSEYQIYKKTFIQTRYDHIYSLKNTIIPSNVNSKFFHKLHLTVKRYVGVVEFLFIRSIFSRA